MNVQNEQKMIARRNRLTAAGLLAAASAAASQTYALSPTDVTAATTANDASGSIDAGALWVLGIVVGIFAVRKIIGMFRG